MIYKNATYVKEVPDRFSCIFIYLFYLLFDREGNRLRTKQEVYRSYNALFYKVRYPGDVINLFYYNTYRYLCIFLSSGRAAVQELFKKYIENAMLYSVK